MSGVLVLLGVLLAALSGIVAACVGTKQRARLATTVCVGMMAASAMCGIAGAVRALLVGSTYVWAGAWTIPEGHIDIRIDPIAAVFLVQVFLIGTLGTVYGVGYWTLREHPNSTSRVRTLYGLIVAGMALLVVANHSMLFLVGWELMTLAAFLALTAEDRDAATRESGVVYLVATRIGTLALIAMFALLHAASASFSLPASTLDGRSTHATAIFCLGILGFGLKAGVMPLHLWLPGAHANAPTHVSALMSGVLIKMGVYGLVRLCSFFHHVPLWWGITLLSLGSISAVLGVAYAIGQHDLKRLLAYHSVENIGIIVMSLGVATIGKSIARADLVGLGLAGALLHTFNHGLFKSLLFFSAGSVIRAVHTRALDQLGGLSRRLPWTALAFLLGAIAICGLPPLNGFISELFLYLGMLKGGIAGGGWLSTLMLFGVPVLAMVGALAIACFVKVHGVVFLGEARSQHGAHAAESPLSMRLPMLALMLGCVTIGTAPMLVGGILDRANAAWGAGCAVPSLESMVPFSKLALTNGLLVAVVLVGWISFRWLAKGSTEASGVTWDCGYVAPTARMQYTASSFGEWLVSLFSIFLLPSMKSVELTQPFPPNSHFETHVPEVVLDLGVLPSMRWLVRSAQWFRWIQEGRIHLYIVYILVALLVMLIVWT